MTAPQAVAAVLIEARRYLDVREIPPGSNRGVVIDYCNREAGLDPKGAYPWCCSWAMQVGRQALGHRWPCPRTASVAALTHWADVQRCLEETPAVGDLFVIWHPAVHRFAHVGWVTALQADGTVDTIEANTSSGSGSREGWGTFARVRMLQPADRAIRWTRALT